MKNLPGTDALRDRDGTTMPEKLLTQDAKIYATYYTTRKDNDWAMQNPEEVQQEYLISDCLTARSSELLCMKGFHTQQLKVNTINSPKGVLPNRIYIIFRNNGISGSIARFSARACEIINLSNGSP